MDNLSIDNRFLVAVVLAVGLTTTYVAYDHSIAAAAHDHVSMAADDVALLLLAPPLGGPQSAMDAAEALGAP